MTRCLLCGTPLKDTEAWTAHTLEHVEALKGLMGSSVTFLPPLPKEASDGA